MAEKRKPILCLDFDGVIHSYTSGWKGADVIPDPPVDGFFEFLETVENVFDVHIYSSRSNQPGGVDAMQKWLAHHMRGFYQEPPIDFDEVAKTLFKWPVEKPPAMVTIDDRAITFTGEWPTVDALMSFKPWNKQ